MPLASATTLTQEVPTSVPVTQSALEVAPGLASMSDQVLLRLDSVLIAAVESGATPGAVIAVARRGRLVRLRGYGWLDHDRRSAVTATTIYDLASLTKVVGTTTAIMILVDEGRLSVDDRVVQHLPGWDRGDTAKAGVTLGQLLLHRSGLPAFRPWFRDHAGKENYRDLVYDEPLQAPPGSRTVYSDIGAITLGFIVEAVSGQPLDGFLQERVFAPLGMADTGFAPPAQLLPRIAPTELDEAWRGVHVHGVVHDENADAIGGVAGHAGLFSTAQDLTVFANVMLHGGTTTACRPEPGTGSPCASAVPDTVRIVDSATLLRFTRRYDASSSRALGWDTPSGHSSAGDYFTASAFGHTGFTGTSLWIDPELELFVVLLTNRVNPTRENTLHLPLRRSVHDLVAQSVTDVPVRLRPGGAR